MQRHYLKMEVIDVFTLGIIVFIVHLTRTFWCYLCSCSQPSSFQLGFCFLEQVLERVSSSVSAVPSFDDYFAHNMWNSLLELLFHEQVSGIFESFVVEIDLAQIALFRHFALDLLCYKEGAYDSAWHYIGHRWPWSIYCGTAPLPPRVLCDIPDETAKALVDCLVVTIFLAVTTTTASVSMSTCHDGSQRYRL